MPATAPAIDPLATSVRFLKGAGEKRAELLAKLRTGGPQSAADLYPQTPSDVSMSEVAFQLARLADEGKASGEVGGVYRLP